MADRTAAPPRAAVRQRGRITHLEHHFLGAVRDVIIGMSDGLTVIACSHIVVAAGIAESAAGGISMGLGSYLAARSDVEHHASEQRREYEETEDVPDQERREIETILASYGISGAPLTQLVQTVTSNRKTWVDFMRRFEFGLEKPNPGWCNRRKFAQRTTTKSALLGKRCKRLLRRFDALAFFCRTK